MITPRSSHSLRMLGYQSSGGMGKPAEAGVGGVAAGQLEGEVDRLASGGAEGRVLEVARGEIGQALGQEASVAAGQHVVAHVDGVQGFLQGGDDSRRPMAQIEHAARRAAVDPRAITVVVPYAYAFAATWDEVDAPHSVQVDLLGRYVAREVVKELFLGRRFAHGAPLS